MGKINDVGITYDDVLLIPRYNEIESRLSDKIDLTTNLTTKIKLSIPVISAPMNCVSDYNFALEMNKCGGAGIIHRFQPRKDQLGINNIENVACAIGLKDYERFEHLKEYGCNTFLIDVANGYTKMVGDEIKYYKDKYNDIEIIAGNICTTEAADYLIKCGADALRCGVGGGSVCITRIITGCGVPNLTAIKWVSEGANDRVPVIADGGIRNFGDCVKAFVFGASSVMLGRMLAPFSRSGRIVKQGQNIMKVYAGQASRGFQNEVRGGMKEGTAPEGVEHYLPMRFDMTLDEYLGELCGAIRSAMTYLNCNTIKELRGCDYIQVSRASIEESYPEVI